MRPTRTTAITSTTTTIDRSMTTTTTPTTDSKPTPAAAIAADLTQAEATYREALQKLDAARSTYLDGAGKAYRAQLAAQDTLRQKIDRHAADAEQAEALFKELFAKAGYVRSKEVKAALFDKNDALSMADELRAALQDMEASSIEGRYEASEVARKFHSAFYSAYAAYAKREAYAALQTHGQALADVIALVSHVPLDRDIDQLSGDPEARRIGFVFDALRDLAQATPAWERRPQIEAHGALDIAPFTSNTFVSLARHNMDLKTAGVVRARGTDDAAEQAEAAAAT